jgi:hypothetical protein
VVSALWAIGSIFAARDAVAPQVAPVRAHGYFALEVLLEGAGPDSLADLAGSVPVTRRAPPSVPEPRPGLLAAAGLGILAGGRLARGRRARHPRAVMDRTLPQEPRRG